MADTGQESEPMVADFNSTDRRLAVTAGDRDRRARRWPRGHVAVALAALVGLAAACSAPARGGSAALPAAAPLPGACQPTDRGSFELPSDKGMNYGAPTTASGQWLGMSWLRTDT